MSDIFPTRIGKITLKDRRGPVTDLRRKDAMRVFAKLMLIAQSSGVTVKLSEKGMG